MGRPHPQTICVLFHLFFLWYSQLLLFVMLLLTFLKMMGRMRMGVVDGEGMGSESLQLSFLSHGNPMAVAGSNNPKIFEQKLPRPKVCVCVHVHMHAYAMGLK